MSEQRITATITVDTQPPREIQAIAKGASDIFDCEEGLIVVLVAGDKHITGIYEGDDYPNVILKSLATDKMMGFSMVGVDYYWEELKEEVTKTQHPQ